jgi:hypothetical protein
MNFSAKPLIPNVNSGNVQLVQQLHDQLIQSLIKSADFFQPPAGCQTYVFIEMNWDRYFFIMLLNDSAVYKRNVSQYITCLTKNFKTSQRYDSVLTSKFFTDTNEIGQLFLQPHRVMSRSFKDRHFFGIGTYNFNSYLRLLFKIKFLQAAAAASFTRKEWFQIKYQKLAAQVHEFKQWVDDNNISAIIAKIDRDARLEGLPSDIPLISKYKTIEEDTFDRQHPFGVVDSNRPWFALWKTEHSHPLQMPFADLYPWRERVLYFLFGCDVRKYFKDYMRSIKASADHVKKDVRNNYFLGQRRLASGVTLGISMGFIAVNLLLAFCADLPLAFLKGIFSLPLRLAHDLTGVSLNGYPENALVGVLFVARILLLISLVPLGLVTLAVVATISSLLNLTASVLIKPLIDQLHNYFKPSETVAKVIDSLDKLKKIMVKEPKNTCFIDEGRLTLKNLNEECVRLQNGTASLFAGLKEKILEQKSFALRFYEFIPKKHHWLVGSHLLNDNFHETPALVFDWYIYGGVVIPEQLAEIAEHLKERVVALTEFQLLGFFDYSSEFCDILIKNQKLHPEVVNFGDKLTFTHLENIVYLLKMKPSIKYVKSLPDDRRKINTMFLEKYEEIESLLSLNRQAEMSLQPLLLTGVEREGMQVVQTASPSRSLTDNTLFSNPKPAQTRVYAADDMKLTKIRNR